ncbi:MAG TPA: hypothetical protein VLF66_11775 [Thermoanaerobaculia bacterium]|nr:hypothetical protein [Thermoanaerobaculia bacterium]
MAAMRDDDCVRFLRWALPRLGLGSHEHLPEGVPGLHPWLQETSIYRG